jgi:hypothetical protein
MTRENSPSLWNDIEFLVGAVPILHPPSILQWYLTGVGDLKVLAVPALAECRCFMNGNIQACAQITSVSTSQMRILISQDCVPEPKGNQPIVQPINTDLA